jgi:phosphohistidine phosphatase SixA
VKNLFFGILRLAFPVLFLFPGGAIAGAPLANQEKVGAVQVFLVRHAEKDVRVRKDPPLTAEGQDRARELLRVLGASGVTHLFSTAYLRTLSTLEPLAQANSLRIAIYDPRQPNDILSKLHGLAPGSVAVVAGHSNTTPQLYVALGATPPIGLDSRGFLVEDAFDRLFAVTLQVGAKGARFVFGHEQRYGVAAADHKPARKGAYLGESLPGVEAQAFALGLVSTGLGERDLTVSASGNMLAYSLTHRGACALILVVRRNGLWGAPHLASFSGTYTDLEPVFDPRDDSLWFASKRPLPGETEAGDFNIWRVTRDKAGWGTPSPVEGLNGPGDEFYPSLSKAGLVVFTATREGGEGGEDLWFATEEPAGWKIVSAGPAINTEGSEFNACLSRDGKTLVYSSQREGDLGGGDLYYSKLDPEQGWQPAKRLSQLNSPALDYCPSFSSDGSLLWFTSRRKTFVGPAADYGKLRERWLSPGNGLDDIYWASTKGLFE